MNLKIPGEIFIKMTQNPGRYQGEGLAFLAMVCNNPNNYEDIPLVVFETLVELVNENQKDILILYPALLTLSKTYHLCINIIAHLQIPPDYPHPAPPFFLTQYRKY